MYLFIKQLYMMIMTICVFFLTHEISQLHVQIVKILQILILKIHIMYET